MTFEQAYSTLLSLANLPRTEFMKDPKKSSAYHQRLQAFLDILGNPQKKIPHVIHITGTSGKGSLVHLLHSILHASGKQVGSTNSPHPTQITERWNVGGRHMSKADFVAYTKKIIPALDTYAQQVTLEPVSYFEVLEALGWLYFADKQVEWVILEAGLGGTFDASNVITKKDVAVITNVNLDHTHILGNTLAEITKDKCGIISRDCGVVYTAEPRKYIRDLIETRASKYNVPFIYHKATPEKTSIKFDGTRFMFNGETWSVPAPGVHQAKNALLASHIASDLGIESSAIWHGLMNAKLPLRMEIKNEHPFIIMDGAHNPHKMASTIAATKALLPKGASLHLLFGASADKPWKKLLGSLCQELNPKRVTCTRNTANHLRKVAYPTHLMLEAKKHLPKNRPVECYLDPYIAFTEAKKHLSKHDVLLVTGSIFLSGQLRHT
ncbi:MAG: hypothetical protein HOE53_01110 [Candidatus Magasanikbacteria bacterium]|jgi:dihydrofolate synthase / folylpolyglutamate synthase|nr:hypothetical protein [Candidatus Magasanikbacteria bacterium]